MMTRRVGKAASLRRTRHIADFRKLEASCSADLFLKVRGFSSVEQKSRRAWT